MVSKLVREEVGWELCPTDKNSIVLIMEKLNNWSSFKCFSRKKIVRKDAVQAAARTNPKSFYKWLVICFFLFFSLVMTFISKRTQKRCVFERLSESDKSKLPSPRPFLPWPCFISPPGSWYKSICEIDFFSLAFLFFSSFLLMFGVGWKMSIFVMNRIEIPSTLSINFPFRIYLLFFSSFCTGACA